MANSGIKLGDKVVDVTSNMVGIVIAHVKYLSGAESYIVQPSTEDENICPREEYVPVEYCKYLSDGVHIKQQPRIGFIAGDGI